MTGEIQEIVAHLRSFNGNVPRHRKESKRSYSFSNLIFGEQLAIWDELWHTKNDFWARVHATFFLERYIKKEACLLEMWPVIVTWQQEVDDWGLCDTLSKFYTRILELMPDEVYRQLQEWNKDENLWKRRQSVVSLLYYSRTKKKYLSFEAIEALITPLLSDREYYVQKGIGWALREMNNVYPRQTVEYLKKNINNISGSMLSTAAEKMDALTTDELRVFKKASATKSKF